MTAIDPKSTLIAAEARAKAGVSMLAERCDGAILLDGKGFSGVDAPLGHALAEKQTWSRRELAAGIRLNLKYKKQLEALGFDFADLAEVLQRLEAELGLRGQGGLRRRDVVEGSIWVDEAGGTLIFKTGFHKTLKTEIKKLPGAKWDAKNVRWSVVLSAESAQRAEELATEFGLELRRHEGWSHLLPARSVEIIDDRLVIRGVNVSRIREAIPEFCGKPEEDEKVFRAIEPFGQTEVAIPLRSWVIHNCLLWLTNIDQDHPLAWAREAMISLLSESYSAAAAKERAWFSRAGVLALSDQELEALRAGLAEPLASGLMPHQWVAVQAIKEKPQMMLGDEQGLGKTVEILAALEITGAWPAVVICPAAARLNWRDEAARWLPHRKVAVLGGSIGARDRGADPKEAELVIVNYESFASVIVETAVPWVWDPAAVVADEAQYLKAHNSQRTETVKDFCRKAGRVIAATGTPILNRPSELLTLLTLLPSMLTELGGFDFYAARYCRAKVERAGSRSWRDYQGSGNLGELANRLRETGRFIRREKAAVLSDLPAKRYETVKVDISNREEYQSAAEDFAVWLKTQNKTPRRKRPKNTKADDELTAALGTMASIISNSIDDEAELQNIIYFNQYDEETRNEALRRVGVLRRLAGVGKIEPAITWIENHLKDEKLVIFAHHVEVQNSLVAALKEAGSEPLTITAKQAAGARREEIQRFQTDPSARVIVCSLQAAKTAITLTAAHRAVFVELDWTPAGLAQAEDRVHRIGQGRQVIVTYIVAPNTMDERMLELVEKKRGIINTVAAGEAPYGYCKDGRPRKRSPGPGRRKLDIQERKRRRKASNDAWKKGVPGYHRDYMRRSYWERKREKALRDLERAENFLASGPPPLSRDYSRRDWERDLEFEQQAVDKARKVIEKADRVLNDIKEGRAK